MPTSRAAKNLANKKVKEKRKKSPKKGKTRTGY